MSKHSTKGASGAYASLTNTDCRALRLWNERMALGRRLHDLRVELPDTICFEFTGLRHLAGYRELESEGLVHARIVRPDDCITVIAATSRVLKHPGLRLQLFALKRLVQNERCRVVIATPRGLALEVRRIRARRRAGPSALPTAADDRSSLRSPQSTPDAASAGER